MQAGVDIEALNQQIYADSAFVDTVKENCRGVIVGQQHMLDRLMLGLLANGHVLLEGLPGLAKTLAIKTLASSVNAHFQRIQFTPDLLPADILGTMIYNPSTMDFSVRKGPIFANFILADEINRAPAKVQSALLESMQERQVTIGKETFGLQEPFLVLATQNPIEQEGTYPLPEAQVDRFMIKVKIDYPSKQEEQQIVRMNLSGQVTQPVSSVVSGEDILAARETVRKVYMDERVENYILNIVFATRNPSESGVRDLDGLISYGASPRASIYLATAAKARAFMDRRGYVIPEDIRDLAFDILRHRIGLSYEAEAENISQENIIQRILDTLEVP